MFLLLRLGTWEVRIERTPPQADPEPVPVDTPTPMEVWTPDYVGFVPTPVE